MKGPVCGVYITNSGGETGTYTVQGGGYLGSPNFINFYPGELGSSTTAPQCTDNPIWSGSLTDDTYITLEVFLPAFNSPIATTDPSVRCSLFVGTPSGNYNNIDSNVLWATTVGGYPVASPSVYSGVNWSNWRCIRPN